MFKIGSDIVFVPRIEKSIKNKRFLSEVFTQKEREHCKSAKNYAGIFAAKEAYLKALGTGIEKRLNSVEIVYDEKGKPFVNGVGNCDISVSHDGEYAFAVAIVWEQL